MYAAREGPNSRISHFLSKVIRNYSYNIEDQHQFKSSEELRAALDEFNEIPVKMIRRRVLCLEWM